MLYAFGFERIGVAVSDLYFLNPSPDPGQEGPERGVRLELRFFERPSLRGSIYSARTIIVDRPIWRVDLLEAVTSAPGSLDRAHYHPVFTGWEPSDRCFDDELLVNPVGWVADRLADLEGVLDQAGVSAGEVGDGDAAALRAALPEIIETLGRLLDGVAAGTLGLPPPGPAGTSVRLGWL